MQILATDFDGTLFRNRTVSEADKAAIERFCQDGNKFGVVTGRHMATALYEMQKQAVSYDFLICCTGGIVLDSAGHILSERRAPREAVSPLFSETQARGGMYFGVSVFEKLLWYDMGFPPPYDNAEVLPCEKVSELSGFHETGTRFGDEKTARQYVETLNRKYPDLLTAHQNGVYVDVCAPHTDKVGGLQAVLRHFGSAEDELSVAGDNLNDLSMIRAFRSFAVSSGREELKAEADFVVSDFTQIVETLL